MSTERYRLLHGDCLSVLPTLPDASVHCVVTSPPYFNLRDYGVPGQLGLESLHDCNGWATGERCGECFICRMTAVFSEVRRVLRDDGTCWVNIGDGYAAGGNGFGSEYYRTKCLGTKTATARNIGRKVAPAGLKTKDLCLIPQRLALSLQADGWFVRCDIVWNKPNPMPESVTDRPTKAHEYVWLLSKSPAYYYDAEAIKEHRTSDTNTCGRNSRADVDRVPRLNLKQDAIGKGTYTGFNDRWKGNETKTRNARSVWTIATQPYPEAHFATFPEELVEPCVLAGCPVGGLVLDPFTGSGTVGSVALRIDRHFVGIELNEQYIALAHRRINAVACQEKLPLFAPDD